MQSGLFGSQQPHTMPDAFRSQDFQGHPEKVLGGRAGILLSEEYLTLSPKTPA
jgi:hypothetical protein